MIEKVIKEGILVAKIGTENGTEVKIGLEETQLYSSVSNRMVSNKGYGFYNWFKVKKDVTFLLQHIKEAVEVSENIDVFGLVRKANENKLKIELEYKNGDLLQVPLEQEFELCKIKSKITDKEYSLMCSVVTRIPLYPLSYVEACFVDGYNEGTQKVCERCDGYMYPFILDDNKKVQRTVIIHNSLDTKFVKQSDTLVGYYPQYIIDGVVVTPMVSCGDFSVARINSGRSTPNENIKGTSKMVDVRVLVDKVRKTEYIDVLAESIEKLSDMAKEDNRDVGEYIAGNLKAYNSLTTW